MPQVAVITGGAGGMGLATAHILGQTHVVLVSDVRADRLDEAVGSLRSQEIECIAMSCDVSDPGSVRSLADRAAELGQVTAVVHTAGLSPQMGSATDILRVNAVGTVNVTEAFLPVAAEGYGLVNVASSAGHLAGPKPTRTFRSADVDPSRLVERLHRLCRPLPHKLQPGLAYALSKSFVIWYSAHRAADFGGRGARIVSVSPGSFDTEMGRLERDSGAGELANRSALGRFGRVEEIAEVLAFCAGDGAGYLTGVDVLVDGGAKAKMTVRDSIAMARKSL